MKIIRVLAIVIILCILSTIYSTVVFAETESFELQLSTAKDTLNPGDSFSVDIVIDNINVTSGDKGIGAYQAKIIYDSNVLELVDVIADSKWEVMENEGNMVANTKDAEVVKERTNTAKINFKVKDEATMGDTTISLENIQGSSGTTTIDGTGVEKTIKIEEKDTDGGNTSGGDDNTTGDNNTVGDNTSGNTNTPSGNNSIGNTNISGNTSRNNTAVSGNMNSNTTSNKVLPHAGLRNLVIIAIAITIVTSIVFYIKYKRAV